MAKIVDYIDDGFIREMHIYDRALNYKEVNAFHDNVMLKFTVKKNRSLKKLAEEHLDYPTKVTCKLCFREEDYTKAHKEFEDNGWLCGECGSDRLKSEEDA